MSIYSRNSPVSSTQPGSKQAEMGGRKWTRLRIPASLRNSQKLQQIGRKFQIERVRRFSEVTGYHYWLITDYPGGTGEGDSWEEGWFDYFWRPKSIQPADGQEINSAVLMMTDGAWISAPSGMMSRGESASQFRTTARRHQNGSLSWTLSGTGGPVSHGSINGINVGLGEVAPAGTIELPPVGGAAAQKMNWLSR